MKREAGLETGIQYGAFGQHMPKRLRWFGKRTCTKKIRFADHASAELAARSVEHDLLITEMKSYWCGRHTCWHIAHRLDFVYEKRRALEQDYRYICDLLGSY